MYTLADWSFEELKAAFKHPNNFTVKSLCTDWPEIPLTVEDEQKLTHELKPFGIDYNVTLPYRLVMALILWACLILPSTFPTAPGIH